MSYAKLGTSCKPMTIACTSNNKYISLIDPSYFQSNTDMSQYDGSSSSKCTKHQLSFKENDKKSPSECKTCSSS